MKEIKKIAILLPSLAGGGAEKVAVCLANYYAVNGYNVDLILMSNSGVYHQILFPKVNVVVLNASRTLFATPKISSYLDNNSPDVLLSFLTHMNILVLLVNFFKSNKTKIVISERSIVSNSLLTYKYFKRNLLKYLMKFFYPYADSIIAISNSCKNDLGKTINIPLEKISVIYNPLIINSNNLKLNSNQENVYAKLIADKRSGSKLVIGIGRLEKVKNFSLLIRAFSLVEKFVKVSLVILGEGSEKNNLEKLIHELNLEGKVHLVGFVDNPSIFLKISDVFVSASSWEGFGNVIVEAMNEGLKIVVADCPGGPREILEDGKWGVLVPLNNVDKLANAIKNVIFDVNQPDVKKRAIQFDLDKIATKYLEIFKINYYE